MVEEVYKIIKPKKEDLNNFVALNPYSSIFQTNYIVDVYNHTKNCQPISLAVVDESNEILSSLVALRYSEKGGILKDFSSHATVRGGPLWRQDKESENAVTLLLQYYNGAVEKDMLYTRLYPLYNIPSLTKISNKCGYSHEGWTNYLIDLNKSEEEIFASFNKGKKKAIRNAKRKGVKVEEITEQSQLKTFYELLKETGKNAGIPVKDISLFESVYNKLIPNNLAKIFLAKHNGNIIAGRLVLTYNPTITQL